MNLLELFTTKPEVSFASNGDEVVATFNLRGDIYSVIFKLLNLKDFQLPEKSFNAFKNKTCVSIIFGNIEHGILNLKATNKNKAFSALSCIKFIIETWIQKHKPDLIVFAAKNGDGSFESRSSLYSSLTRKVSRELGYSLLELNDANGKYFIVSRDQLTSDQVKMIKREVLTTFKFGKLK